MPREFTFASGTGISVTPTNNNDGTETLTITNTAPGAATPVSVPNGGTGDTTLLAHSVLVGEGTSAVATVGPGATGIPLIGQGGASDPVFGTAAVGGGGTGKTAATAHTVQVGAGTSAFVDVGPGTSGQVLTSNGGAADPSFQPLPAAPTVSAGTGISVSGGPAYTVSLSTPVTVPNGGTNRTSVPAHAVVVGNGASTVGVVAPINVGDVLTSQGASLDPIFAAPSLTGTDHNHSSGAPAVTFTTFALVTRTFSANESAMVTATMTTTNQDLTHADSLSWGISLDSTSAVNTPTEVVSLPAGSSASGAICWKFVTPGTGSHTIRILALRGGTASSFSTDTQLNVMYVTA